jgi:hypothetical protein
LQAWSYKKFSSLNQITTIYATKSSDAANYTKIQFLMHDTASTDLRAADFISETYSDLGLRSYDAFLEIAYDYIEDWQRFRQAPYIMTYMQKTETGFTAGTDELLPINESWLTMQARWDFADNSTSGKWGTPQQIYRHKRLYTPEDVNDTFDNGQPILICKNKVRGRGRSLHLRFDSADLYTDPDNPVYHDQPAHLLGWAITYAGSRKV